MVTTDVQLLGQTDYYLLDCGRKKNINCRPFTMKAKLSIFCYFVHLVYQFVWKVESSKFFIIIIINFIEIIFTIIARRHLWLRVGGNFFYSDWTSFDIITQTEQWLRHWFDICIHLLIAWFFILLKDCKTIHKKSFFFIRIRITWKKRTKMSYCGSKIILLILSHTWLNFELNFHSLWSLCFDLCRLVCCMWSL